VDHGCIKMQKNEKVNSFNNIIVKYGTLMQRHV